MIKALAHDRMFVRRRRVFDRASLSSFFAGLFSALPLAKPGKAPYGAWLGLGNQRIGAAGKKWRKNHWALDAGVEALLQL
jgi:hypothetical protein